MKKYEIIQNYPNPFNNSTIIKYSVPKEEHITLKVFNLIGEELATLIDEVKQAGNYRIAFNPRLLSSGVFFYKLQAGNFIATKKMILMK